ncbi:MAG: hypothetical protein Q9183_004970 [Haloplaca sp. 2 TL-2023]
MANEDAQRTSKSSKDSTYPECLIIPPVQEHKQTFILLHGRGSNATTFGPPFLDTKISETQTLRSSFPHAKFILPTASKRRAQIYHRSVINQWFDNWSLETPNERTYLQIEGLRESSAYIHLLLQSATEEVGAENVVLGGLSQGCATTLVAVLTWNGEPIRAAFGMCGWLPFRKQMEDILITNDGNPDDGMEDVFETYGGAEEYDADVAFHAVGFLREELGMDNGGKDLVFRKIPLFLAHGAEDHRVPVELGREAVSCLKRLDIHVEWCEYDELGHWYSGAMLRDLVSTLKSMNGWEHTQDD